MSSILETLMQYGWQLNVLITMQLLIVMGTRSLFRHKLGTGLSYKIWALPVLALPLYFTGQSALTLITTLFHRFNPADTTVQAQTATLPDFAIPVINLSRLLDSTTVATVNTGAILAFIWLAGIATAVVYLFNAMRKLKRLGISTQLHSFDMSEIHSAGFPAGIKIELQQGQPSPALAGILQPVLLLPADFFKRFTKQERELMLKHEHTHMQRHDNLWNLLFWCLRSVFWFNPLLYLAWRQFRQDQELSCDALTLKNASVNTRKQYMSMLLATNSPSYKTYSNSLICRWGNHPQIKERMTMIIKQHNRSGRLIRFLIVIFTAGIVAACSTAMPDNPAAQAEANATEEEAQYPRTLTRKVYKVIEQAQTARNENRFGDAIILLQPLYEEIGKGNLNDYEKYVTLAMLAVNNLNLNEDEKAVQYYNEALEVDKIRNDSRIQVLSSRSHLYYSQGKYTEALSDLNKILELTNNPPAQLILQQMSALYQLEQYREAVSHTEEFLNAAGNGITQSEYLSLATFHRKAGNELKAMQFEEKAEYALDTTSEEQIFFLNPSEEYMLPIVKFSPLYPSEALSQKTEGWVHVEFTVDYEGNVKNPQVVDANPERVFDDSALAAISKFKFNPRMENGSPLETNGVGYVFTYKLDE